MTIKQDINKMLTPLTKVMVPSTEWILYTTRNRIVEYITELLKNICNMFNEEE